MRRQQKYEDSGYQNSLFLSVYVLASLFQSGPYPRLFCLKPSTLFLIGTKQFRKQGTHNILTKHSLYFHADQNGEDENEHLLYNC
mmetsp:Transcript_14476/g.26875  ORF Transcript_14476/g.26875 Transcript_14476/m.26875 type:complete len:85 (+) Transcript_14476:1255-1509(+)